MLAFLPQDNRLSYSSPNEEVSKYNVLRGDHPLPLLESILAEIRLDFLQSPAAVLDLFAVHFPRPYYVVGKAFLNPSEHFPCQ